MRAKKLHDQANVPLAKCGVEEIKEIQRVLTDYQIHVLSKEHFNAIIYRFEEVVKKIYLYMHDEHFDVIMSMPF